MEKFDHCIFIGRFSPFHLAHEIILNHAFEIAKNVVIVIGSSCTPRTVRNPWTSVERETMIRACLSSDQQSRVKFIHMKDYLYNNNMWVSVLQEKINQATADSESIAITGYKSDNSTSFYLDLFPQFTFVEKGTGYKFHATQIRHHYFSHDNCYKSMLPKGVVDFLEEFKKTPTFSFLKKEKDYLDNYKEQWRGSPFPVIFCTTDAVVLKSGHVLLVERGRNPGKGLLALPGGFVKVDEALQDACLRELKEETNIKVPLPELRKAIVNTRVFDDPKRSERGRTITTAYLIDLGMGALPKVKGDDDASSATWYPLSDVYAMQDRFFEDHFHVIRSLVSNY